MTPSVAANVVLDTGPLVALLDADEAHHRWAVEQFSQLRPPLLTCEAVLSEACFLIARIGTDPSLVTRLVERGVLTVTKLFDDEATPIGRLMTRYRNVPMSLADACLMRIVEVTPNAKVFTLDRDFSIYRQARRRVVPLIAP
jgi:uncharacterized protein